MPTVAAIRTAAKDTIQSAIPGLVGYDKIRDLVDVPAFVVAPGDADFNVAFGRGFDTWNFDVIVLVNRVDAESAQDLLDGYVNGFGGNSIRQAVFNNRSLGVGVDAHISGVSRYGASWEINGTQYYGAALRLVVHTSGTE